MPTEQAMGLGNAQIIKTAKAAWDAAKGKPYQWSGHTTDGFDCSGFVCYVLQRAYPAMGIRFMTAADLFDSQFVMAVKGVPQLGDLIGFRHGGDLTHDHVGIVYDTTYWIGSQSSTGVSSVSFSNFYWSKIPHFFLRWLVA
jgi:cell wall-associated NlpC family hydrolase